MITYIIIFILLIIAEFVYFRIADKCNIIDKPNERSSHSTIVLRGGGIIFLIGVWVWGAFFGFHYPWFLAGLTLVAGVSFVDDIHSLPDSVRLVAQFTAAAMAFYQLGILPVSYTHLDVYKRQHQVIEKGFDITFDWYGNTDTPEYETNCHNLIRDLHMDDRFVFHQATNDIIPEYQKSLAFCLPSIYEGFPNVVCEAMSCGVPVLCSNVCDNPNIITSDKYGFLFDPNNVDDIANAFFRFLRLSSNHINKMGNDCRDTAIRMFSKQIFVKKYIEIIESE